jgi:type IV pilus assembly protein PilO
MPTNQRDQIMLAVGVIGLLGSLAYWNWVYSPKGEALQLTRDHIERSTRRIRGEGDHGPRFRGELQEDAKRLQANLDLMHADPDREQVPSLLDQILGAARRTGLEFSNFAPTATVQGESFDTYRFKMSMQGSYHQIGELLTAIGSLRRIIVPVNVSLTGSTSAEARRNRPEERILTANFDIQTYVVRTSTGEDR